MNHHPDLRLPLRGKARRDVQPGSVSHVCRAALPLLPHGTRWPLPHRPLPEGDIPMAHQEEQASDQLKQDDSGAERTYPEEPTNTPEAQGVHGKGTRTRSFEVEPAVFVAITTQQHADAVRALTELLTQHLHHSSQS